MKGWFINKERRGGREGGRKGVKWIWGSACFPDEVSIQDYKGRNPGLAHVCVRTHRHTPVCIPRSVIISQMKPPITECGCV